MLDSKLSTDRQTAIVNLELYTDKKTRWLPMLLERLHDDDAEVRKGAAGLLTKIHEQSALSPILDLLKDKSDDVRRTAIEAIKTLGDGNAAKKLVESAQSEEDIELKIQLLETALSLGNADAIPALIQVIEDGGVFADDAYDHLKSHIQFEFKSTEVQKAKHWWEENKDKLQWDANAKMFVAKK